MNRITLLGRLTKEPGIGIRQSLANCAHNVTCSEWLSRR